MSAPQDWAACGPWGWVSQPGGSRGAERAAATIGGLTPLVALQAVRRRSGDEAGVPGALPPLHLCLSSWDPMLGPPRLWELTLLSGLICRLSLQTWPADHHLHLTLPPTWVSAPSLPMRKVSPEYEVTLPLIWPMVAELAFEPGPPPSLVSSLGDKYEAARASCSEGDPPSSVFISSALLPHQSCPACSPPLGLVQDSSSCVPPIPTYQGPAAGPRHNCYHHSLVRQVLGHLTGVWEGLPKWGTCLGGKEVWQICGEA